ncbi:MAG TPA: SDR family NAD(P)-dependent oxidoreductase, partial [Deltaproteobacteria bacterium]|nr:SDR family NAD(P)-dependent oxidoreductase [Deltaproteobacteria bacterium]
MDLGLKDKVAVVAGGSMGLGKAVALQLSREGAKIAIGALDDPELPKATEEIKGETGGEVIAIPVDVTIPEQAKNFVRKAIEHYGTIDILVNNAGGPPAATFLDIDDDLWIFGFKLNLMS